VQPSGQRFQSIMSRIRKRECRATFGSKERTSTSHKWSLTLISDELIVFASENFARKSDIHTFRLLNNIVEWLLQHEGAQIATSR
jgi:hypothetical protein